MNQFNKDYPIDVKNPTKIIDLTNCEREPIHIPGSIQPHGVLFVLNIPSLQITQVSNNTQDLLGIAPERLLQQDLAAFLPAEQITELRDALQLAEVEAANPLLITPQIGHGEEQAFDGVIHRVVGHEQELLLLELEVAPDKHKLHVPNFYQIMRTSTTVLQGASSLFDLCQFSAEAVRKLTGFDRIMIYRFHEDWHGEVIAEARNEDMEPYLGLHYPASDIPSQARELYRHNWLRLIADVAYQPAAIIPTDSPLTQHPLNLSSAVLRSVSPMHIQYLKNMGVAASMSISILKDNQLWGLISCHHNQPKFVPYTIRAACEFLGQLLSLQIVAREDVDDYAYEMKIKDRQAQVLAAMRGEHGHYQQLLERPQQLLQLVGAQGAAFFFDDSYTAVGKAPDATDGRRIVAWLQSNIHADIFVTDSLSRHWPEAEQLKERASGLLAISIPSLQSSYVLWFRPEVIHEVTWGGDPHKPVQTQEGSPVLHPRTSFASWSETVNLQSQPWKAVEVDAARAIRSAIIDRVLQDLVEQRARDLQEMNKFLADSNEELDAFAYIVSHDLKEPLRGITNYVHILKEDYAEYLDAEGVGRLNTLLHLTQRLDILIDSLLHYSRVGRVNLAFAQTDLNAVLENALAMVQNRIQEKQMIIRIPRPLPTVWCDRARIGEIFTNLISNALKYNDKPDKWIEIGYQQSAADPQAPLVFYVRDNGIGIRDRYFDLIFQIFKRLHGRDKFDGGAGAGLTIVKRIVERHGGKIWLESTYGEGTTFYFTLQEG
ncbi:ATP-binding protein [Dictyobacter alpinus]|nr:ATP-binding protein [Dictyobacter alpinus]